MTQQPHRKANASSRDANSSSRDANGSSRDANASSRDANASSRDANASSRGANACNRDANASSRNADASSGNNPTPQPPNLPTTVSNRTLQQSRDNKATNGDAVRGVEASQLGIVPNRLRSLTVAEICTHITPLLCFKASMLRR